MAAGPLVHYAISALGPVVTDSLGLSATQFGGLWFVTFGAAALCTVTAGRAADRLGARSLLIGVFALSTVALLLAGIARTYGWLLVGLALSGVAQSLANPATNQMVGEVPAPRQGLVLGVKQSGVQVSQLLAGLLLPPAALLLGWRYAIGAGGIVTVMGLVLTVMLLPRREAARRPPRTVRTPLEAAVPWVTVYAFLAGAVTQATNVYLPLYAHQHLHASVTEAGLVTAVLGGCGVAARFLWGYRASRVRDYRHVLTLLAALASVAILAIICASAVASWLLWVGAALFSCSVLAANVVVMLVVVRAAATSIGRSTGWVSLGLFLGFMVGPLATGVVVDGAGFVPAWGMLLATTMLLTTVPLVWQKRVPLTTA
jgi:MFS family permease